MQQKELAALLGVSPAMVSRHAKKGMPTDTLSGPKNGDVGTSNLAGSKGRVMNPAAAERRPPPDLLPQPVQRHA